MLIGITGKSGEGKSTFSRFLMQNLPNAQTIHCDAIFFPAILSQKDKLKELYGENIVCNDKLNLELYLQYPEKVRIIHDLIDDLVCQEILHKIKEFSTQTDFVIIEWFRLHEFELLVRACNVRIIVKSENPHQRYKHLAQRHSNPATNHFEVPYNVCMEQLNLRDQVVGDYGCFPHEYVVINKFDETLFEEAKQIASNLQNNLNS